VPHVGPASKLLACEAYERYQAEQIVLVEHITKDSEADETLSTKVSEQKIRAKTTKYECLCLKAILNDDPDKKKRKTAQQQQDALVKYLRRHVSETQTSPVSVFHTALLKKMEEIVGKKTVESASKVKPKDDAAKKD